MADVVPTAKAQRWDPAEVVRILLAEEAAGRDAATLRSRRKRASFPSGKTFDAWDENTSTIPRPTQQALRTLEWVHRKENLSICGPDVILGLILKAGCLRSSRRSCDRCDGSVRVGTLRCPASGKFTPELKVLAVRLLQRGA
jgi:IstB-like ATP binding protein